MPDRAPPLDVTVRPLEPDELPAAQAVAAAARALAAGAAPWRHDPSGVRVHLGVVTGGSVLGVVVLQQAADEAEVLWLAVAAGARRRGIGIRLVQAALAHVGSGRCVLEVRSDNVAAVALYAGLGFTRVAVRATYYADGVDALVLVHDGAA